jgi:hypothetical protein
MSDDGEFNMLDQQPSSDPQKEDEEHSGYPLVSPEKQ